MKTNTLEAAPTARAVEEKNNTKSSKAKRILVGVDVHLRGYQAARKVDGGVIGAVETCRSEVELLLHIEKQRHRAEQVVVVYEAGPLGYTLYRKLSARGVSLTVDAPVDAQSGRLGQGLRAGDALCPARTEPRPTKGLRNKITEAEQRNSRLRHSGSSG